MATAADLRRLAGEAERRGVRILVELGSGETFATSASDAGRCYRVTAEGCTCPRFRFRRACAHHSLFLARRGWLSGRRSA